VRGLSNLRSNYERRIASRHWNLTQRPDQGDLGHIFVQGRVVAFCRWLNGAALRHNRRHQTGGEATCYAYDGVHLFWLSHTGLSYCSALLQRDSCHLGPTFLDLEMRISSTFPPFGAILGRARLTSALAAYAYGLGICWFGYPGIKTRLTVTPGFSQSSTPFYAS
jgi:hypothetical protein